MFLRGELPLPAVTADELDRAIGTLYATVEQVFGGLLRIGFASRFPRADRADGFPSGDAGRRPGEVSGSFANRGCRVLLRRPGQPPGYVCSMAAGTFDLVIVGGGNMGAALAGGLLAGGIVAADRLAVAEALADRRGQLAELLPGVHVADTIPPSVGGGARRQAARRARCRAGRASPPAPAACCRSPPGCTTRQIERAAAAVTSDPVAVIRAMPNTPALVGQGASAISGGSAATDDDLAWAEAILGGVGLVVRVAEADLDAVTGLSGSGPAYVFLVAEALIDAAVDVGLSTELAIDADDAAARRLGSSCSPSAATRQPCGRWSRRPAARPPPGSGARRPGGA